MSRHEQSEQGSFSTENQEGLGRPRQKLISQRGAHKKGKEQTASNLLVVEQNAFYPTFWERLIEKSSVSPLGEDPAFWPIDMFVEFEYLISEQQYIKNPAKRELAEKLTPIKDSLRRIKTAYSIAAYPQCQQESRREFIEASLEGDRQLYGRDQIELNNSELEIVGRLCTTPRSAVRRDTLIPQPEIPFNPQKRLYRYSEVPLAPDIDPYGRRHMTTEEIRRGLTPKPQLPKT